MIRALVLTGFGINCEEELAQAYKMAGASPEILHINELLLGKRSLHDYDILNFPGGFSFGDDIASGKVMSNKIKYKKLPNDKSFLDEIKQFLQDGKFILGICNGFQMLVRMGLLPNIGGKFEQEATLHRNDSGHYEDRWVYCKANPRCPSAVVGGMDVVALPVRHGEGKLIALNDYIRKQIIDLGLNALTYCHEDGKTAVEYPANPNGAELSCAGLSDPSGQVFGLMPHPEAYLSLYNHPDWGKVKRLGAVVAEEGEGLGFFQNLVKAVEAKKKTSIHS